MVLNVVWLGFFVSAFAAALVQTLLGDFGVFPRLMTALFDAARTGFDIALGLTGVMALWLGFMKIGERAGMIDAFARGVSPLMRHLFPGVPAGHPAQGAMTMNLSANLLGLDNAATPLGLKAMQELQSLNPRSDVATNAQVMFLVLNTAGLTLIPTSVIAIRQTLAAKQGLAGFNAADIFLPTLLVTAITLVCALVTVALVQGISLLRRGLLVPLGVLAAGAGGLSWWLAGLPAADAARGMGLIGSGAILSVVLLFLVAGALRRVNVYEAFVDGAKEGFGVAVGIIPYLIAMLVAIAAFRSVGLMDLLMGAIAWAVSALGLPTDFLPALPVGLMKVLSGSGARGLMVDVMQAHGVDSFAGKLAAIIQGSTETTFYVLAVYFGSVGVKHTRHALPCALLADAVGLVAAVGVGYAFLH
ncbi:MAG: nucleoside recognition domain-containing protein [Hydrogenophaga sp.]|uniref:nucleoside recognition domain-containing protein n=1 Tax=Hydrogenophaga sp. TaxID=1904254 RepID=UPI0026320DB7|nr:spore maturation protein [Hydrogenophaga sp.]MDD3785817.1 nucleoside recognition domain-containing protein [Hydrogenophaga sp.]MDX9968088.1 nucleoside recognition domain-containing protein [Hydrogenophaga sp.]